MPLFLAVALVLQDVPSPPIYKAWEQELDSHILGAPVVHGELAIAASRLGTVKAFRLDTGEPAWEHKITVGPVTRLVVQRNQLYVPAWDKAVALDPVTGTLRKKPFVAGRLIPGASKLYLVGGYGFNGFSYDFWASDFAACFDPQLGKQSWKVDCPRKITSIVEGVGRVYLAGLDHLEAVDSLTGKREAFAERASKGSAHHGILLGSQLIYVQEGQKQVVCYDAKTLKEKWLWTSRKAGGAGLIPPVVAGNKLILFPLPDVVCIDPRKEGARVWSVTLEGATPEYSDTPPALRENELTIGVNGKLMGMNLEGTSTWTLLDSSSESNSHAHQPVWVGDRLLYATGTKLCCFKMKEQVR